MAFALLSSPPLFVNKKSPVPFPLASLISSNEYLNDSMLYLKSKLTDTEVDIYKWELEYYKIKSSESTIYVKLKNKMEVALMY